MPSFIVLEPARDDIADIVNHIAADNLRSALRVYDAIESAFRFLSETPGAGPACDTNDPKLTGLRYWPVKKYRSYLIIYRQVPEGVEIVRVFHGARDMDRVLRQE